MKVRCVSLGNKPGQPYWTTVDREYDVLSIMFTPSGGAKFRIMANNGETPYLEDAALFAMPSQPVPDDWVMKVLEGGVIEIGPAPWMELGFWERYFDGDPSAISLFRDEAERMGANFQRDR